MDNEKKFKMVIAKRIHGLRKALNLKQGELADKLGCSRSNLSQIEHGVFFPGFAILNALISTFNVSLDWLFAGKGSMFICEKENLLDLLDFGKDTGEIIEMLKKMKESPAIKHGVLSDYYTKFGI